MNGRVSTGVLGCPVCHARYPIESGVVHFTGAEARDGIAGPAPVPGGEDPIRLAAQLDLSDEGGLILLTGRYATQAADLIQFNRGTFLLVDAAPPIPDGAIAFELSNDIPLTSGALRAAALAERRCTPTFLTEVVRCVRNGGRIVAQSTSTVPEGVRVIARDEREWVAAVERPTVVPLRRPGRP